LAAGTEGEKGERGGTGMIEAEHSFNTFTVFLNPRYLGIGQNSLCVDGFQGSLWFNQQYCEGFNTERFGVNAPGNNNQFPFLQLKFPVTQGILHTSINNHEKFVGIVMGVPDEFPLSFHQFYLVIIEPGNTFAGMKLMYQTSFFLQVTTRISTVSLIVEQ
jgi:hypothetical protein